ncbi:hypothetical protein N665_2401s0002 [Sinapis alba]|nr:hypothetical protein N665_2401s0002 [Sinapis alba]
MAATNSKLIILVLLICLLPHIVFSSASAKDDDTKAYVDSLCQTTKYQDRCVRWLSPYVSSRAIQSPEDLIVLALKASLTQALHTLELLKKVLIMGVGDLSSLVVQLRSILGNLTGIISKLIDLLSGRDGVGAKNINLQRLTSTALTDAETLVSKFQGRKLSKLEAMIYGKVKNVEETTSIALAFIQHYAATRH